MRPAIPAAVEGTDAGSGDRGGRGPGGGTGRGALPDHVVAGGIDEGEALDAPLVTVLASRYFSLDIQLHRRWYRLVISFMQGGCM